MSRSSSSLFESYNRGYNVGVGGAVVKEGRILLVRRATARGRGYWQIPGGFVERDETLEQAVVREVQEEAAVEARPRGVLALRSRLQDDSNSTYVVFLLDWSAGDPTPDGEETDRAEWLDLAEVEQIDPLPSINLAITRRALSGEASLLSGTPLAGTDGRPYTLNIG